VDYTTTLGVAGLIENGVDTITSSLLFWYLVTMEQKMFYRYVKKHISKIE